MKRTAKSGAGSSGWKQHPNKSLKDLAQERADGDAGAESRSSFPRLTR